jgi:hypothetical protein
MNLEKVAALLGESDASQTSGGEILRLKELQRRHEKRGGIAGLITLGLVMVLFILLVFTQMIMRGGLLIVPGSILILLAIGAAVMGYFQASAKSLKQKLAEPQLPQPAENPINSARLPPPGSVTEQTTKLLAEQDDRSTHEIAD